MDEGGKITYTATLTNPAGTAMTVTLSNGAVITIDAGKTTGSVTVDAPNDDVYLDAGTGRHHHGAPRRQLRKPGHRPDPGHHQRDRHHRPHHLSLSAERSVAEGGQITYTATLTNPAHGDDRDPEQRRVINIDAGQTTGSVNFAAPSDDVTSTPGLSVTSPEATGGNLENLVASPYQSSPASPTPSTPRPSNLTATDNVNENGTITYTASVDGQ